MKHILSYLLSVYACAFVSGGKVLDLGQYVFNVEVGNGLSTRESVNQRASANAAKFVRELLASPTADPLSLPDLTDYVVDSIPGIDGKVSLSNFVLKGLASTKLKTLEIRLPKGRPPYSTFRADIKASLPHIVGDVDVHATGTAFFLPIDIKGHARVVITNPTLEAAVKAIVKNDHFVYDAFDGTANLGNLQVKIDLNLDTEILDDKETIKEYIDGFKDQVAQYVVETGLKVAGDVLSQYTVEEVSNYLANGN